MPSNTQLGIIRTLGRYRTCSLQPPTRVSNCSGYIIPTYKSRKSVGRCRGNEQVSLRGRMGPARNFIAARLPTPSLDIKI